ncbi:ParA family protein [Erysipelothrix amsterdamensis]|uniref:ParA family protein n=1 Tax=Erysipelothrix amsterdamensis TaxID=2929157 RepID=A0AAU9VHT8_9FIRM|nr:ParA family protein [Erysipelothrix sp. A18Y020d]CAH2762051.1 ParA family protein [Erysipelothrix sp. A18Y020d]
MMKVTSVYTFKGGVGKTITTIIMAIAFALRGQKVLVIDIDPQCNLTNFFVPNYEGLTLCDCIFEAHKVNTVIQATRFKNISIIPASMNLVLSNDALIVAKGLTHLKFRKMIESLDEGFERCLIDCPPYYTELVVNALFVSNEVIIPFQGDKNSQDAFHLVTKTLDDFNGEYSRRISYRGLFTGKKRNNNDTKIYDEYLERDLIYDNAIRFQGKPADEMYSTGKSIFEKETGISKDYREFIEEYLLRESGKEYELSREFV